MEQWKDIKNYEGMYQISNYGRVKSLDRLSSNGHLIKSRYMKVSKKNNDYLYVGLSKSGVQKKYFIHRLVALAFIDNPHDFPQINHIDENKTNNYYKNLEWCTQKYNNNYGTKVERQVNNTDYTKIKRKMKCKKVMQLSLKDEIIKIYPSARAAARQLNISQGDISKIASGKGNTYKGFKWKYIL